MNIGVNIASNPGYDGKKTVSFAMYTLPPEIALEGWTQWTDDPKVLFPFACRQEVVYWNRICSFVTVIQAKSDECVYVAYMLEGQDGNKFIVGDLEAVRPRGN